VTQIPLSDIVWDPKIYPRKKWSTATIERYVDALASGTVFPPMTLEEGTNRLFDGKHRYEMYKVAEVAKVDVQFATVPKGMTAKYFAATLSSRHGDRMSNADLKSLAEDEFTADMELPENERRSLDPTKWGRELGVSKSAVYRWVGHILNREKATRAVKAWRLAALGWTQAEIGERLGASRVTITEDVGNSQLGKIDTLLGDGWNDKSVAEVAQRMDWPLTDAWAAAMQGMDDDERLKHLELKTQPYDVWNFSGCHDLMGDKHPGRIPGELVCHVLYFYTKPGDLVIDPMAGSGTTLDACLLMGRKCRGYDIDHRHDRIDVETCNLAEEEWPEKTAKAALVFWDPPYFDKMDDANVKDGYCEGSISKLPRDEYLAFFAEAFASLLSTVKKGTRLAFLMSDWNDNKGDKPGIFLWDYVTLLQEAGWAMERHIQAPLPTQQVHPDIVNKYRASRKLARLERYLLIARK